MKTAREKLLEEKTTGMTEKKVKGTGKKGKRKC